MKLFQLFLFVGVLALGSHAQSQCENLPSNPSDPQLPFIPIDAQYQASIERNADGLTEDMQEYYDGKNNVGVVVTFESGAEIQQYAYYGLNELIMIAGDNCVVRPLDQFISLTPFQIITINGTQHILSPLNSISNRLGLNYTYVGAGLARGIPVVEWRACNYKEDTNTTTKITVSYSDKSKWLPATPTAGYESVPIQVTVEEIKNGKSTLAFYSVMQFKKFQILEEEKYFTPSGVYCPGRKNLKEAPKVPSSFMFSTQMSTPIPDSLNRVGTIETVYEEYNLQHKLFRYVYSSANSLHSEIHDYSTGLFYKFDRKFGTCEISKLTTPGIDSIQNGSFLAIRDPNQFFDFDGSNYQYVGLKRRDGVNTDVWVGKRAVNGYNATVEWYFMSDLWNKTEDPATSQYHIPILIKIVLEIPKKDKPTEFTKLTTNNHIFGFSRTQFNLHDYDISNCDSKLEKKHFIFRINNDLVHLIRSNIHEFEQATVRILQEKLRVTVLRISNLKVVFDSDGVYVLFTLFDRASFYGPVPIPDNDLQSLDAVKALNTSFLNDQIQIEFKSYDDKDEYIFPVVKTSLLEIGDYNEGFVGIEKDKVTKGFSGVSVAIVTVVVAVVGVVFGLFLIILQKSNKINLPFMKLLYNQ